MPFHRFVFATVLSVIVGHLLPEACSQTVRATKITRVFWQDRESQKLSYADVVASNKWDLNRGWVQEFPKLDAQQQQLAGMQQSGGVVMIAVDGDPSGNQQRGWVAIDSGVFEEPHGNHFHWRYTGIPAVKQSKLQKTPGHSSRVYKNNNVFYVPNPSGPGFTQANSNALKTGGATTPLKNFPGGSGRMSLAAVNNTVCYAAWDEAEGDNAGRVDVINLQKTSDQLTYSFNLPSGSAQHATVNSGKVFFATDGGVYWTIADTSLSKTAETVQVNALATGQAGDAQERFQANNLVNAGNAVLSHSGEADASSIQIINAASSTPTVTNLPIDVADGLQLTTPKTVLSLGKQYAFVFQERIDTTSDIKEQLTIIEIDPNRDRSFNDAVIRTTIPVGASKVVGANGHHGITFDAYGRYAIFTNPGDGVITLMSLNDLRVRARFRVEGAPDKIIAVGAAEHFH